jgi:apolipoprotein N-acyltransferase
MNIGAEAIVLLTNDAWFERTSSPHQHHIISVFRAIENRTFFVSCANTGVSGVIDPYGRILQKTPIYEDRIFYAHIYPNRISTFYSYMGDIFSIICFILSGGGVIYIKRKKRKELLSFEFIFIENIVKPLEKVGFTR